MKNTSEEFRQMRDGGDENHLEKRVVICEPSKAGLFGFGKKGWQPAKVFTQPVDDRNSVPFSTEASALMQRRAKATYKLLRDIHAELTEFKLPILAKLAYGPNDNDEDNREYLWFEVHELKDDAIEATLLNEPFSFATMKAGDRATHSIERLTDWQIMTPGVGINPRRTSDLRWIRENKENLRAAMREAAQADSGSE